MKFKEYLDESSNTTKMKCMECSKEFKKKIGKGTVEVKCPKCGSYDTEVNEGMNEDREMINEDSEKEALKFLKQYYTYLKKANSASTKYSFNRASDLNSEYSKKATTFLEKATQILRKLSPEKREELHKAAKESINEGISEGAVIASGKGKGNEDTNDLSVVSGSNLKKANRIWK